MPIRRIRRGCTTCIGALDRRVFGGQGMAGLRKAWESTMCTRTWSPNSMRAMLELPPVVAPCGMPSCSSSASRPCTHTTALSYPNTAVHLLQGVMMQVHGRYRGHFAYGTGAPVEALGCRVTISAEPMCYEDEGRPGMVRRAWYVALGWCSVRHWGACGHC